MILCNLNNIVDPELTDAERPQNENFFTKGLGKGTFQRVVKLPDFRRGAEERYRSESC